MSQMLKCSDEFTVITEVVYVYGQNCKNTATGCQGIFILVARKSIYPKIIYVDILLLFIISVSVFFTLLERTGKNRVERRRVVVMSVLAPDACLKLIFKTDLCKVIVFPRSKLAFLIFCVNISSRTFNIKLVLNFIFYFRHYHNIIMFNTPNYCNGIG